MKDWNWKNILVSIFLVTVLLVAPAVMVGKGRSIGKSQTYQGLPQVEIYLKDTTLVEIRESGKEIKYSGNVVTVTNRYNKTKFDNVTVKGRGNVTWNQDKKPLQLKFDHKVDLLRLGARRKWILLANYLDVTNLRTDAAFYLERLLGEKYAYNGEFVDLYVDDSYEGLYYLTRAIEIDKGAIDLKDPLGVLVELDNVYGKLEEKYYVSGNGEVFTAKDAVAEDNVDVAMDDFLRDFNILEMAIKQKDYARIERMIDVESFAQYYLISEFTVNIDSYFTSVYFYKDGKNDKIHAGPAWDFDNSFTKGSVASNDQFTKRTDTDEYFERDAQYWQWSKLYSRLIEFPEFEKAVRKVYMERMAGHKEDFLKYVTSQAEKISQAATKDRERWNKEDFIQGVEAMLEWIDARYDYLDREYGPVTIAK